MPSIEADLEETHAMNSLLAALSWPRAVRVHAPAHPLVELDVELPDNEWYSRCGWFDSSLELAVGVEVTEYVERLPDDVESEGLLWPGDGR
jgi:hypothetical protein